MDRWKIPASSIIIAVFDRYVNEAAADFLTSSLERGLIIIISGVDG
jgi:hypothetical protein